MKKNFYTLLLTSLLSCSFLAGCGGDQPTPTPDPDPDPEPVEPPKDKWGIPLLGEPALRMHYKRKDITTYKDWCLWMWCENADGKEYTFDYDDNYGLVMQLPLSQVGTPSNMGFIVKKLFSVVGQGVWTKDWGSDRFVDFDALEMDENQIYHAYIYQNDGNVYTDFSRKSVMNAVSLCEFANTNTITVKANNPITSVEVKRDDQVITPASITKSDSDKTYTIKLTETADIGTPYTVASTFQNGKSLTKNVAIRKLYDAAFENKYYYSGELGAIYTEASTTFRVWSPVASRIVLKLYNNGTPTWVDNSKGSDVVYKEVEMVKGEKGVFSTTIDENLEGKYYTYTVYSGYHKNGKEIVDPYAKSAGVNGLRGMIVDFSKTNPDGWDEVTPHAIDRKALTVYETHVADVTSSKTWGGDASKAKKFAGMYQEGTRYTKGNTVVKTGFDHIKELGVNAVQIIPFFDQANDEVKVEFNWGYNPLNYNVVEGCYSSNPFDGYVRIRELKELVKAYNVAGINIIMDVVYNHVNGLSGSNFDVLMPGYYFRYKTDGSPSSGSGCGNDTASERKMYSKFMSDSVAFWAQEYKLGGFRFDLMGLHDINTMNSLVARAKTINPNIVIFGEPWNLSTTTIGSVTLATQSNAKLYQGFGQFNDQGRDAGIKGGLSGVSDRGYITDPQNAYASDMKKIGDMIKGATTGATTDPDKTVNYFTCHDNYTLHDRALAAGITDEAMIKKMNLLANSIVMMSEGTSFMLAGEEFLRSKPYTDTQGNPRVSDNSYNASYETNELNYELKVDHKDLFDRYVELIHLKQALSCLHYGESAVSTNVTVDTTSVAGVIRASYVSGDKTIEAYFGNGSIADDIAIDLTDKEVLYVSYGDKDNLGNSYTLPKFGTIVFSN